MAWQGNGLGVSGGTGGGGMPGGSSGGGDFWSKMMQGQGGKGGMGGQGGQGQGGDIGGQMLQSLKSSQDKSRLKRAQNWQQGEQGMAAGQVAGQAAAGAGSVPQQRQYGAGSPPQFGALPSMVPAPVAAPSMGSQVGAGLSGAGVHAPQGSLLGGNLMPGGNSAGNLSNGFTFGGQPRPAQGPSMAQQGSVQQAMGGVGGMMSDERTKNTETTSLRKRYAALGGR